MRVCRNRPNYGSRNAADTVATPVRGMRGSVSTPAGGTFRAGHFLRSGSSQVAGAGQSGKKYLSKNDASLHFMKSATPTLLPLLRSQAQGDIIAHIMLDPEHDHSASEIAASLGLSLSTVSREVARLVDAGLLAVSTRGNTRLLRVQTDNPVYRPLADLMAVTFGPVPVLRRLLAGVPGIEAAFIYGSWAARHAGQPGSVPGDIDLLVIGSPDRHLLADVVEEAERALRREVNTRRLSKAAWEAEEGPFTSTVTARPMVEIVSNREAAN